MDGSLNTGRFPGGLKTLVGLKDLLDLLQQQEERRRPKTASSVFSSEKFYWQQLGRRGEKDARFFFFFPAVGLQATTAAVTNDKKRRKKKWLLSTISWLKKAFFLIFFTLLLIFQRFFNCNRRWWRRSRRNFKEDILAGDNLILLSSLHSRAFTSLPTVCKKRRPLINLSFIFLLKANPLLVLFWRVKKWNWTAENRWTVFITRTTLVKNRAEEHKSVISRMHNGCSFKKK